MRERNDEADRRLESAVAWVLRVGVALSVGTILAGTVLLFVHHPDYRSGAGHVSYRHLVGMTGKSSHAVGTLIGSAGHGEGSSVILLGLLVLVLTPVARVVLSVAGFLLQREWRMVFVTAFVLAMLVGSLVIGGVV